MKTKLNSSLKFNCGEFKIVVEFKISQTIFNHFKHYIINEM